MVDNKRKGKGVMILLLIAVLLMTVGFAAFVSNLQIDGTVNVTPTKWSVHYVSNSITPTSGSVTATASVNETTYSFEVDLEKPGDFYEATVQVTNDGDFDAVLTSITMSGVTSANSAYLLYTVTYDDSTYASSTTGLSKELDAGATENVKVRVEYLLPADAEDLPTGSTPITVNLTGTLHYDQVLATP